MSGAPAETGEQLRVLLVEDTRSDAELCLAELERGGYRVTSELVQCEQELRSTLEDWILVGLRLRHVLPRLAGIDLNRRAYGRLATHQKA